MAKRIKRRKDSGGKGRPTSGLPKRRQRELKYNPKRRQRRRPSISDARIERSLRVYSDTKDLTAAARSIHVSPKRFRRALERKFKTKSQARLWAASRRLPRTMPIFSGGKQLAITVRAKSASLIGHYMSAVRQFLRPTTRKSLAKFKGLSVRDVSGKIHTFEPDPNTLYRLSSASGEPFEEIYRIVI